jgi:methionyl-tRNA synthetase
VVAEENVFFRLSAYQAQIEDLLESGRYRIVPDSRRNEILSFVRSGLRDFSITRSAERAHGWGIEVPGDSSQVIYVWLDALTNYLSGLGYHYGDELSEFWTENALKIHVLGKDISKFHAIYWPAFLLSAGLPLPDAVLIHGFLTVNGRKISKSSGNAIDPFGYISQYGSDAVRYYLLRALAPYDDGDFSSQRLNQLYNADLANGLGNLVSRLTRLGDRSRFGHYIAPETPVAPEGYHDALNSYRYDRALAAIWKVIRTVNKDIEVTKPWEWLKDERNNLIHPKLSEWLGRLHTVAYWIRPFLPVSGTNILNALSRDRIASVSPLFPRIKLAEGDPGDSDTDRLPHPAIIGS